MNKKVLLTSVCRPMGPKYGDAPSVGYELLYGQVTRAQGLFSPRTVNIHYSLEYIAENLDAPTVVLQYPSERELIRELKKGYDYVGVSFLLAVMHKMKETVALIRKHAPNSKIVLGGYGTVLNDEALKPYGDYFCREEGVGFFRRLLGEPELPMPYKQPLLVSSLKVFGSKVSTTGQIFAGLGCPNGCDFCCTSHFFSRQHIRLLPEGKDIYAVAERYLDLNPDLVLLIIDEEQKFGVSAKEKLKNLKVTVDTLTLTATPIPRTLQFSLMGARDLSVINTPPPNRHPIVTELHTFNEDIIREGIMYEISRSGQVFFINNFVQNIREVETLIRRLCPGIKTCVGGM